MMIGTKPAVHAEWVNDWGGLKCRASERRAELVRAMPSAADIMQSPNVAHSPGQRPGETYAAINTFGIFAPWRKNATRLKRVTRNATGRCPS